MIIATPGRLKDILVNHGIYIYIVTIVMVICVINYTIGDVLQLIDTKIVVLDEVDSLLEMGFKEQVNNYRYLITTVYAINTGH